MLNIIKNCNQIQTMQTKRNVSSSLIIFFYLTHVKREEIGPLIQFLQKFNLSFGRIKKEKQIRASYFLRQNSNFMAYSSKPISFEEFQTINSFLNTQAIVVGYEYGNFIWNVSRTKMQFLVPQSTKSRPEDLTWSLLNRVHF